ncbi:hypothetical protein K2173_017581 [Erythroxylum novogranatense]|uniref:Uncharacterized protein n=1 Tax=Erythroxylum novogranatense TaxID=1862640 RepID=A0AAV8T8Q9_9ROSI|nr:hypothetical protein K2173_017581 [Erythroxylum novogranatense]
MKPNLMTSNSFRALTSLTPRANPVPFPTRPINHSRKPPPSLILQSRRPTSFYPICSSTPSRESNHINEMPSSSNLESSGERFGEEELGRSFSVQVGGSVVPSYIQSWKTLSMIDQALLLLSFAACTASVTFTSLVVAAVPTLYAMRRAATSLSKLADTAREELPSTMAAIRLSGMEISDLTLELSDLSNEIADGVKKSTQTVQAAEAGIQQIGALAHQHTISMIEERASLPIISWQPVVAGAAKKTTHAVGQATKTFMNIISRGEFSSESEDDNAIDRVEI